MKVLLTYFKPISGKMYTTADYETKYTWEEMWKIVDEVRKFQVDGKLPGLVEDGGREFYIVVEPDGDVGFPALILPYDPKVTKKKYQRI